MIKVRVIPVPANPLVLADTDDLKIIPHRKQGLHPGLITDTVTVGVIFRAAYRSQSRGARLLPCLA